MKILLLSDANSPHTIKWAKSLYKNGLQIAIWSLNTPKEGIYDETPNIIIRSAQTPQSHSSIWSKLKYLTTLFKLKRFLREMKPDILHAHYATSYGLLGRLSGFQPFIISVWGTDVYEFPKKGKLFARILKENLESANKILSTSEDMKKVTANITDREIIVTPFGIDLSTFKPSEKKGKNSIFTFGIVKTLEHKYGIDCLIQGFALFKSRNPMERCRLLIVGGGSQEKQLKELASRLGVFKDVEFTGLIPYAQIPEYHRKLDVAVFPSNNESFGVAAIEASAMNLPVIVSSVGGLPEVIEDGITGIVVPPRDTEKLCEAMERLYFSAELRLKMGNAGRKRVEKLYDLDENVAQMISIYKSLV